MTRVILHAPSCRNTRLDLGKMNIQLKANVENEDGAERGQNEAGGMIAFICGAGKHVGNAAAEDRSDDAEHDGPEDGHVHVHRGFGDKAGD